MTQEIQVETEARQPTQYELMILQGLQHKPVFGGLRDEQWPAVDRRRAKNKVARRQRKVNRRNAA